MLRPTPAIDLGEKPIRIHSRCGQKVRCKAALKLALPRDSPADRGDNKTEQETPCDIHLTQHLCSLYLSDLRERYNEQRRQQDGARDALRYTSIGPAVQTSPSHLCGLRVVLKAPQRAAPRINCVLDPQRARLFSNPALVLITPACLPAVQ